MDQFHVDKHNGGGRHRYCKECRKLLKKRRIEGREEKKNEVEEMLDQIRLGDEEIDKKNNRISELEMMLRNSQRELDALKLEHKKLVARMDRCIPYETYQIKAGKFKIVI